ncbi:hypothetical protein EYC80_001120 [Monilinia laxa]|uniref:Uncharacterized protein n=1 Tax=Monilinia laxa TaxID=61186 RepID=A0A5N6K853_MONLA|nr:hypothetical protein EYC80_001120 [Monilinia laxa]
MKFHDYPCLSDSPTFNDSFNSIIIQPSTTYTNHTPHNPIKSSAELTSTYSHLTIREAKLYNKMKPVVGVMQAWSCIVISVFAIIILSLFMRFSSSAVASKLTYTSATIEEELFLSLNGRLATTEGIYKIGIGFWDRWSGVWYSYEETRRDLDPSKFNCGLIKLSCLSLNLIGLISGTCGRAPRPLAFLLNMIILR